MPIKHIYTIITKLLQPFTYNLKSKINFHMIIETVPFRSDLTFQVHSSLKTFSIAACRAVFSSNFINNTIISSSTKIIVLSYMENKGTVKISRVLKEMLSGVTLSISVLGRAEPRSRGTGLRKGPCTCLH